MGPERDGQHTFMGLAGNPRWAGIWDLDEAGPYAIRAYLSSYGPATDDHIHYWFGAGLSGGRKRLNEWLSAMQGQLTALDVDGQTAYLMSADVEAMMAASPTEAVRLLARHDQWVMGPGTKDEHVVPRSHRGAVTRRADLVVAAGVVTGTWEVTAGTLSVTWFAKHGEAPREALRAEVRRLATRTDRSLTMALA